MLTSVGKDAPPPDSGVANDPYSLALENIEPVRNLFAPSIAWLGKAVIAQHGIPKLDDIAGNPVSNRARFTQRLFLYCAHELFMQPGSVYRDATATLTNIAAKIHITPTVAQDRINSVAHAVAHDEKSLFARSAAGIIADFHIAREKERLTKPRELPLTAKADIRHVIDAVIAKQDWLLDIEPGTRQSVPRHYLNGSHTKTMRTTALYKIAINLSYDLLFKKYRSSQCETVLKCLAAAFNTSERSVEAARLSQKALWQANPNNRVKVLLEQIMAERLPVQTEKQLLPKDSFQETKTKVKIVKLAPAAKKTFENGY